MRRYLYQRLHELNVRLPAVYPRERRDPTSRTRAPPARARDGVRCRRACVLPRAAPEFGASESARPARHARRRQRDRRGPAGSAQGEPAHLRLQPRRPTLVVLGEPIAGSAGAHRVLDDVEPDTPAHNSTFTAAGRISSSPTTAARDRAVGGRDRLQAVRRLLDARRPRLHGRRADEQVARQPWCSFMS